MIGTIATFATTAGIIWINRAAYRKIDELDEL
jgi:hypothetical protein